MCQADGKEGLKREDGFLAFMSPGSPQCTRIFGSISLKHPEKSKRYSPDKGEMWVLCSLVFQQVSRTSLENICLGTVADRTVAVGICRRCDLTCDPRGLYRIWHLPALLPLLCLVCPDSSALGIGDVVLQRYLTGEHFCASPQPCPQVRVWLVAMFPRLCLLLQSHCFLLALSDTTIFAVGLHST